MAVLCQRMERPSLQMHEQGSSLCREQFRREADLVSCRQMAAEVARQQVSASLNTLPVVIGEKIESWDDWNFVDCQRKGKKPSNSVWESKTDHEARMATRKDGRTSTDRRTNYTVDPESGASVGSTVQETDRGAVPVPPQTLDPTAAVLGNEAAKRERFMAHMDETGTIWSV